MVKTIIFAPGAVTAGTNISLPDWAPKVSEIAAAIKITLSDASTAGSVTSLTVTSTTPSSGEIQLVDESTIVLGDDTTARDVLVLIVVEKGEYSGA